MADPLETHFSTTCVTMPNLVILDQTVRSCVIMVIRQKVWPLTSRLSRLLKVIGTDMDLSAIYDFIGDS